jgi:hypothetical protein
MAIEAKYRLFPGVVPKTIFVAMCSARHNGSLSGVGSYILLWRELWLSLSASGPIPPPITFRNRNIMSGIEKAPRMREALFWQSTESAISETHGDPMCAFAPDNQGNVRYEKATKGMAGRTTAKIALRPRFAGESCGRL